jgi:hypothetical protein
VAGEINKNEFIFPFERLEVWQLAVDLADYVLNPMESFPVNKLQSCYCLKRSAPQVQRSFNS